MRMYDCLPKGSQVKLWDCTLETIKVGGIVPDFELPDYVVLLREGGYIKVEKGIITQIVENHGRKYYYPGDFPGVPCFDKYGQQVITKDNLIGPLQGLEGMKDPYYPVKEATDGN